jgi:hypothetical protein
MAVPGTTLQQHRAPSTLPQTQGGPFQLDQVLWQQHAIREQNLLEVTGEMCVEVRRSLQPTSHRHKGSRQQKGAAAAAQLTMHEGFGPISQGRSLTNSLITHTRSVSSRM